MMRSRMIGLALLLTCTWSTLSITSSSIRAQAPPSYSASGYAAPASAGPGYAGAAATRDNSARIPLYATRQSVFAIPFTVDRRVVQPVEVHLYVSVNQGANWQLHSRQPPNTRQFTYRAPGDGEYWFASRTLDAAQQATPQGSLQPELRVVVDTVSPQIEFTARPGEGGEVVTSWQVYDQNLLASSLKVEYQEGVERAVETGRRAASRGRGGAHEFSGPHDVVA